MKKDIKSKKIISMVLIALLLLFTTNVYAANDSFGTTIQTSTFQVKREDNITITIGLKDIAIESGEKGIGAYTANIKFDSSVLEYVSANGTDKWESPFYQNGLIVGNTENGEVVSDAQNIGTITFKVKKDAKLGETTIELTNFSGSTVENDVSASDKSITITIVDSNNANNNGANDNVDISNNEGNNNIDKNNSVVNDNSSEKSNTSNESKVNYTGEKQGVLPKAGTTNSILFAIIGVCTLLAIIFFIKIRLIDKKL